MWEFPTEQGWGLHPPNAAWATSCPTLHPWHCRSTRCYVGRLSSRRLRLKWFDRKGNENGLARDSSIGILLREFSRNVRQPRAKGALCAVHEQIRLSDPQKALLAGFVRRTHVLCLSGAWCGDCVNQCPIFDRFAIESKVLDLRFVDRDANADLRDVLAINGGKRVPVVVFLSEDFDEVARYGDRTLSTYRRLASELLGAACPTGLAVPNQSALDSATADWLDEFERVELLLRLSPKLRERHGD